MEQQQSRTNSRWAIASFSIAIVEVVLIALFSYVEFAVDTAGLFLFCLSAFPPLSFICGIVAFVDIARNRDTTKGRAMALVGAIPMFILTVLIITPFLLRVGHPPRRRSNCLNNLKQIGTGISLYQTDWDDKYPLVSGPGRAFEEAMGQTWNYRTNSTGGERRWMQDLLGVYAKSKKIFWCPALEQDASWAMGGKHPGVVYYWQNRHGGFIYNGTKCPDIHGKNNPDGLGVLAAPDGSTIDGLLFENDPLTSYWFNAVITDNSGKNQGTIVVSGHSPEVCDKTADAPIVWDTPCGYAVTQGEEAQMAHEDVMNVLYADGHAKPYQILNLRAAEWTKDHFGNTHGYEGWFPE